MLSDKGEGGPEGLLVAGKRRKEKRWEDGGQRERKILSTGVDLPSSPTTSLTDKELGPKGL